MKLSRLIFLLFLVILVGVGLSLMVYYGYYLQEYHEVPFDFHVRNGVVGLDADTDALHFGGLTPGGSSQRFMNITPARDARLVILFTGNGSSYVFVNPNNVAVNRGTPITVTFTAAVPANMTLGNYTGVAKFYFYRR